MGKYKLTKNTKVNIFGKTLFQIEALEDFSDVEKGDLGGYIEKEENLSQEDDAQVYGNAWVSGKIKLTLGYFLGDVEFDKEEVEKRLKGLKPIE